MVGKIQRDTLSRSYTQSIISLIKTEVEPEVVDRVEELLIRYGEERKKQDEYDNYYRGLHGSSWKDNLDEWYMTGGM